MCVCNLSVLCRSLSLLVATLVIKDQHAFVHNTMTPVIASFVIGILQQGNRSPLRSASPEPEPSLTVASTFGADPNAWQRAYQHRSSTSPVPWHQQAVNQPQQRQQQAQGGSRGRNSGCSGSSGSSIARRMHSMAQVLPLWRLGRCTRPQRGRRAAAGLPRKPGESPGGFQGSNHILAW